MLYDVRICGSYVKLHCQGHRQPRKAEISPVSLSRSNAMLVYPWVWISQERMLGGLNLEERSLLDKDSTYEAASIP